jgi:uridine phosphorylase
VPPICLLDPDGDIVRYARAKLSASRVTNWACYHSEMWEFTTAGVRMGIVGNAVGGAYSVLVAEQMFASGCQLLMHISSAGQIADLGPPPYHILIDRALRDEGTSYHYLPASAYAEADPLLVEAAARAITATGQAFHVGATWTTDAPFRETAETIAERRQAGILAVEMEAASLYAFATARSSPVICIAHVSNRLGAVEGDFEKGEDNGARCSLKALAAIAGEWSQPRHDRDRAASQA